MVTEKKSNSKSRMSVSKLKEQYAVVTETVDNLRYGLIQRHFQLLDTNGSLLLFLTNYLSWFMISSFKICFAFSVIVNHGSGQVHGSAKTFSGETRSNGFNLLSYSSRTHRKVAKYTAAQRRSPVKLGATDLICCRTLQGLTGKVLSLDWTPESNCIVSASQDVFVISSILARPLIRTELCQFQECAVETMFTFHAEDAHLITSSGDQTCVKWNVTTSIKTYVFGGEFQSGHIADVLSMDKVYWNAAKLMALYTYCAPFTPVSQSANQTQLDSCDTTARLWDTRAANRAVQTLHGHKGDVNTVKFFPDGYRLGTGSGMNMQVVLDSGELKDSHMNHRSCLEMLADGSALCTGSWDSNHKAFGEQMRVV
ncbi:unnamed protein product [Eruca vesicaria subsp. sativa]|uniref:Uncharacterized protein n=1 Tax=Eruca vesicaria subsp. sativa TaxID=29727 RepID=A0ABC8JIS2_ERUVS|nr:unnamed protein product [Eruca vesicaria subsp. sativa]